MSKNPKAPQANVKQHQLQLTLATRRQGLVEFTAEVASAVAAARISTGLCTVFVRHTSASLIIQENADPSARRDLEVFLNDLVPESYPKYTHTMEGPDDMPSHIKNILTATTLSIPVVDGHLALGTWQGIYLWEHRRAPHNRQIVVHIVGE